MSRRNNGKGSYDGSTYWFILEADHHAGHRLGLCNPAVMLLDDDGREYGPPIQETQLYMWELRANYLRQAFDIINGEPFAYMVIGDITHGRKYIDGIMTTRIADQWRVAKSNIAHVARAENCVAVRLMSGTSSHIFGEATSEITVMGMLRDRFPKKDIRVLGHSRIRLPGDVTLDTAHHGPGAGIRAWTRGNVARHYLRSNMWKEIKAGRDVPALYIRAHYHTWVHEYLEEWVEGEICLSQLIVMPSLCGLTEYGRQATASEYEIWNGLVLVKVEHGRAIVYPFTRPFDIRVDDNEIVEAFEMAKA